MAVTALQIYYSVSVCLSKITIFHDSDRSFLSDLPKLWNIGHTCDNENQVRWPIKPEMVNTHARQFTSGLVHF